MIANISYHNRIVIFKNALRSASPKTRTGAIYKSQSYSIDLKHDKFPQTSFCSRTIGNALRSALYFEGEPNKSNFRAWKIIAFLTICLKKIAVFGKGWKRRALQKIWLQQCHKRRAHTSLDRWTPGGSKTCFSSSLNHLQTTGLLLIVAPRLQPCSVPANRLTFSEPQSRATIVLHSFDGPYHSLLF